MSYEFFNLQLKMYSTTNAHVEFFWFIILLVTFSLVDIYYHHEHNAYPSFEAVLMICELYDKYK